MRKIYWDSCVLIYRIQGVEPWSARIAAMLEPLETAQLCVTDLTRLECRTKPLRENDDATLVVFDRFFARTDVAKISMSPHIFDLATALRARHKLKTPDALHLAAAITAGCDEFWTNDEGLARAAEGRIRIVPVDQP